MVNIQRVRAVWDGPVGTPYYSNFYFGEQVSVIDIPVIVREFLTQICGFVNNAYGVRVDPTVTLIDQGTAAVVGFDAINGGARIPGTDSGEALPLQTQGLIGLVTAVVAGTRRLQGRFYAPAPSEANNVAGNPLAAYVTNLQNAGKIITDFNDGKEDDGDCWVVWSRAHGVASAIRATRGEGQWATQRTRGARG